MGQEGGIPVGGRQRVKCMMDQVEWELCRVMFTGWYQQLATEVEAQVVVRIEGVEEHGLACGSGGGWLCTLAGRGGDRSGMFALD